MTRGRAEIRGFPGHDWTASFVRYEASPSFWPETLVFGDWANEEGTNGDVSWGYGHVKYPQLPRRLKEPFEAADTAHLKIFNGHLSWRNRYEARRAGTRRINGMECYEIVLTPPQGSPMSRFLDKDSHLLVKSVSRVGGTLIETFPSDYRRVDGVLLPHKVRRLMSEGGPGPSVPFLRPGAWQAGPSLGRRVHQPQRRLRPPRLRAAARDSTCRKEIDAAAVRLAGPMTRGQGPVRQRTLASHRISSH